MNFKHEKEEHSFVPPSKHRTHEISIYLLPLSPCRDWHKHDPTTKIMNGVFAPLFCRPGAALPLKKLLAVVFGCLTGASSLSAKQFGPFTYEVENGALTITDYQCSGDGEEMEIPSEIEGSPVTGIGSFAFYRCTNFAV